jgi:hypothetical protein
MYYSSLQINKLKTNIQNCLISPWYIMADFLYHLTNVFTNCTMNIVQLLFKLLEVTLVLVRKSLYIKIKLVRTRQKYYSQSSMTNGQKWVEIRHWKVKVNQAYNKIRTGHVNIKLITNFNTYITKCKLLQSLLIC